MSWRKFRRNRTLVATTIAIIVGAAVLLAVLAWPSPASKTSSDSVLKVDPAPKASGPITVTGVETPLVWHAVPTNTVEVTVKNTSDKAVNTKVWWILGKPKDAKPWLDAPLESAPVTVRIDAGKSTKVRLPAPELKVPAGYYRLSLWAHTRVGDTGGWTHSDGRSLLGLVQVLPQEIGLTHTGGTSDTLWLQSVAKDRAWTAGGPGTATVQVVNSTSRDTVVQVWFYLTPSATKRPWDDPASVQSATVTATANSAGVTSIDVPMPKLPKSGTYKLSVWLHQVVATKSLPRDGVLVTEAVQF